MTDSGNHLRLGVIGIGAIGEAMIIGLIEHANCAGPMSISQRNQQRSSALARRFGNLAVAADNQSIVDRSDVVFVSVLPDQARDVISQLRFREDQTLVSLMAGIAIDELRRMASPIRKVHRIIPLPPIEHGTGPLPLCPPNADIKALFQGCAAVIEMDDEDQIAIFSAASGLMAPHHQLTSTVARWMTERGVAPASAAMYSSNMFRALADIETRTPPE